MQKLQTPFVLLFAPVAYRMIQQNQMMAYCGEVPRQDKIRGTYENKIRFFSPPEKIFETFASVKTDDGKLVMSYLDFFRSLTPYNYTEIRDSKPYFEKFHPDILKVADSNDDGVISFPEFFFFVTILQIPSSLLANEFLKASPDTAKMTKDQFSSTLTKLRKQTALGHKQTNKGFIPDARMISAKEEEFLETNREICNRLFEGKDLISFKDFENFRKKLKTSLRHYEFYQYDVNSDNDAITIEDFAKSILVCLPFKEAQKYQKRIEELNLEGEVTFNQFIAFQNFIDEIDTVKEKVLLYRYITKEQLLQLCEEFVEKDEFCKENKVKITDSQVEALVKVLDLDGNGQLDHDEVIGVLQERQALGQGREDQLKEAINSGIKKGFSWVKDSFKF